MSPERADAIAGFDHVSLPLRDTEAMVAFYRALGLDVAEHPHVVSVYVGDQMINFHRPTTWQREGFTLRAPAGDAAVRRSLLRVGRSSPSRWLHDSTRSAPRSSRARWTERAAAAPAHRASTCAIPTGTSSSS